MLRTRRAKAKLVVHRSLELTQLLAGLLSKKSRQSSTTSPASRGADRPVSASRTIRLIASSIGASSRRLMAVKFERPYLSASMLSRLAAMPACEVGADRLDPGLFDGIIDGPRIGRHRRELGVDRRIMAGNPERHRSRPVRG